MVGRTSGSLLGSLLLLLLTDLSLLVGLLTLDLIDFKKDLSFLNFDVFCWLLCPMVVFVIVDQ